MTPYRAYLQTKLAVHLSDDAFLDEHRKLLKMLATNNRSAEKAEYREQFQELKKSLGHEAVRGLPEQIN